MYNTVFTTPVSSAAPSSSGHLAVPVSVVNGSSPPAAGAESVLSLGGETNSLRNSS